MMFLKLSSATILSLAAVASAAPSCPATLETSEKVNDMVTMYYAVVPSEPADANNGLLCARLEAEGEQWVGFGISTDGKMVGSGAIIGTPEDGAVKKYAMNAKNVAGVVPADEGSQTLKDASLVQEDGMTKMAFTKMLVEDGEIEIRAAGENTFLYARGSGNTLDYHGYGDDHRGMFKMDFGGAAPVPDIGDVTTTGATAAAGATTVAATTAADATTAATTAAPEAETTTAATTAPETSSGRTTAAAGSLMATSLATMFLV